MIGRSHPELAAAARSRRGGRARRRLLGRLSRRAVRRYVLHIMNTLRSLSFAFLASTSALACSSASSTDSADGTSNIDPAVVAACDAYFDTFWTNTCGVSQPTGMEQARQKARFEQSCASSFEAAGSTFTATAMQACVAAIHANGCMVTLDPDGPCAFELEGTLAAGASCSEPSQCASGNCGLLSEGNLSTCGTCGTPGAAGAACTSDLDCGPFFSCSFTSATTGACSPNTYGSAGASCNFAAAQCAAGFACDSTTLKCAPAGAAGASCTVDPECAYPLVCVGAASDGTGKCASPGDVGATCDTDSQCKVGLGCDPASRVCAAVTWAGAGQPCGPEARCQVGVCPEGAGAVCPTIVADGAACEEADPQTTCDAFASCRSNKCVLTATQCE
jgi:hypothetical protein